MIDQLEQRFREIAREEAQKVLEGMLLGEVQEKTIDIESQIKSMLHNLGISSAIKGFRAITKAVLLVYENPVAVDRITDYLYPSVALQCNTTPSRTERNIRHAIERSAAIKSDLWTRLFPVTKNGKPTNSEFIVRLAEELWV